jgi:DnaJ family protein C protein 7
MLCSFANQAGQFLARGEGGDDGGMWKEVADEVRRDAERLFKLIGEANAILSDPQKVPICRIG